MLKSFAASGVESFFAKDDDWSEKRDFSSTSPQFRVR
jgi:hypothetical protein